MGAHRLGCCIGSGAIDILLGSVQISNFPKGASTGPKITSASTFRHRSNRNSFSNQDSPGNRNVITTLGSDYLLRGVPLQPVQTTLKPVRNSVIGQRDLSDGGLTTNEFREPINARSKVGVSQSENSDEHLFSPKHIARLPFPRIRS